MSPNFKLSLLALLVLVLAFGIFSAGCASTPEQSAQRVARDEQRAICRSEYGGTDMRCARRTPVSTADKVAICERRGSAPCAASDYYYVDRTEFDRLLRQLGGHFNGR